jgi:SAM-dependent methyltransferase
VAKKSNYIKTTYSENRAPKSHYPTQLISYLTDRFKLDKGNKVLEVGCGRGDFIKAYQEAGFDCYGIDLDPDAKEFSPGVDVRVTNIDSDKFPFDDNFFDVIYHKSVIEHVFSPNNLMEESKRVLKPGGKMIILTPDWVSQMKVFYEDITHCRPYTPDAMIDLFKMYELQNFKVEHFKQLPATWNSKSTNFIANILRLFMGVLTARKLTKMTNIKFFRWSVELMILGYGEK